MSITSRSLPLVDVGAPTELVLSKVAEKLRMPFALPRWSAVANAVGAVAGSVVVTREAIIYRRESTRASSHVVQVEGERRAFSEADESLRYALKAVRGQARDDALAAGVLTPRLSLSVLDEGSLRRVRARAIGSPGLAPERSTRRGDEVHEQRESALGLY